jgi:hypothetical protein
MQVQSRHFIPFYVPQVNEQFKPYVLFFYEKRYLLLRFVSEHCQQRSSLEILPQKLRRIESVVCKILFES